MQNCLKKFSKLFSIWNFFSILVEKFQNTSSRRNERSENTTWQRNVLTPDKLEERRQLFEKKPTLSTRSASQGLMIGYSTVQRTLRNYIDFFPYKVQSMQSLTGQNIASRLVFARMVKSKIDQREINIIRVWSSNEAHFYLTNWSRDIFFLLYQHFGNQVIVLDYKKYFERSINWPPYSPDLNLCDFFLWEYLKAECTKSHFQVCLNLRVLW